MADVLGDVIGRFGGFGGLGAKFVLFFQTIFIGGLFAAIFFFLINFLRYKVKVVIYDITGGGIIERTDKGRYVKKKTGERGFQLWKSRKFLPEPDNEYIISTPKGKKVVYLTKMGEDDYRYMPIKSQFGEISFEPSNISDNLNWFLGREEKAKRKHRKENVLLQLAPYLTITIGIVAILFMFMMLLKKMDAAVPAINAASSGMQNILKDWITVVREFTVVVNQFSSSVDKFVAAR